MDLIFLGPPGAGKGTQAEAIVERFHIPQISTGDIVRATMRDDSPLGQECRSYANRGLLVPDDLVNRMVEQRLAQADAQSGFLLDGYPRTVNQAEALDAMLAQRERSLDHVLLLEVPDDVLVERITGRRSDPVTGKIYHVKYEPAPADIAHRLVQREDDTEEVLRRRLGEYHSKTAPLIPYYERASLLRRIDGLGDMDEVRARIFSALESDPGGR